jgi:hypothetical protein
MPRPFSRYSSLFNLMRFAFVSSLLFAVLPAGADDLTAAKKADILKLLEVNGTGRVVEPLSVMVTQSYMQPLRNCTTCSPKIPDVVRSETKSVLSSHLNGDAGLLAQVVPVYHEHFTHAEIKQLLAFYSSAVGKKLVSQSNDVARGSIQVSQQWLNGLAPEIKQRIDGALTKAGIKPTLPGSPPPSILQSVPQ